MDLRDELRSLTQTAPRTAPDDGVEVYRRGRRRLSRRRVGAGAVMAVVLLAGVTVVDWSAVLGPSGVRIEDGIAGQPEGDQVGDEVVLDLPDGWRQVQVGSAVFGVPGEREVVELAPTDALPCFATVDARYAYVAPHGYPGVQGGCPEPEPPYATVFASTLSQGFEQWWSGVPSSSVQVAGFTGEVHELRRDGGDDGEVVDRAYVFPGLDLLLEFHGLYLEDGLDQAVVATLVPLAGAAGPTDAAPPEVGQTEDVDQQVVIGGAQLTVPAGFDVSQLPPEDGYPCHAGRETPLLHLAAEGAPVGDQLGTADGCSEVHEEDVAAVTAVSVLATTASTVPPMWLPGHAQEDAPDWDDIEVGGEPAQAIVDPATGLYVVRSETLDLYLEVAGRDLDPALVDELLAGIRPVG